MRLTLSLLLLSFVTLSCQELGKLEVIEHLPPKLKEVSGIEKVDGSPLLWMVNDSGNAARIYGYNFETDKIEKTIKLTNGKNKDWEDLASDGLGTLYIGDFGNNSNNRKDLAIYGLKDFNKLENDVKAEAAITTFFYEDQELYPPKKNKQNFDVEAFFYYKEYFYLFTRNRNDGKSFDGLTKLYKIPAIEGHFMATLIGSFNTCENFKQCQITSAAIHRESGKVALLSYNQVWIFSDYKDDRFFDGKLSKIDIGHFSQKESILFKSENELYIADEMRETQGGNLYLLKL